MRKLPLLLLTLFLATACVTAGQPGRVPDELEKGNNQDTVNEMETANLKTAIFAGGCFWCMEAALQDLPGVTDAVNGYIGGEAENPSYKQVSTGTTGYREAVKVTYDPSRISYGELLDAFWRQIDPTDAGGQFADRGSQYRTAIYYRDEQQRLLAEESKRLLAESGRFDQPIVTEILPAGPFYTAEEEHQDYFLKRTAQYQSYKKGSGRAGYIEETWKDVPSLVPPDGIAVGANENEEEPSGWDAASFTMPSEDELKAMLSPLQYDVTRKNGTERAFDNAYWNNHADGIYVDIVSGEPLFSSLDKYDSGTGWPSFTRPLDPENIVTEEDHKLLATRTEARSAHADSHLGHVFADGPADKGGMRYCMNSAALKFIPKDKLEEEGYGEYLALFNES